MRSCATNKEFGGARLFFYQFTTIVALLTIALNHSLPPRLLLWQKTLNHYNSKTRAIVFCVQHYLCIGG